MVEAKSYGPIAHEGVFLLAVHFHQAQIFVPAQIEGTYYDGFSARRQRGVTISLELAFLIRESAEVHKEILGSKKPDSVAIPHNAFGYVGGRAYVYLNRKRPSVGGHRWVRQRCRVQNLNLFLRRFKLGIVRHRAFRGIYDNAAVVTVNEQHVARRNFFGNFGNSKYTVSIRAKVKSVGVLLPLIQQFLAE